MKYRRRARRYSETVNEKFPVASVAALIADISRAAMLTALLDGRAASAGELARAANASAQSASMHLAQLLQGGLVEVAQQGRHRYYRIASPAVAHAVEALGAISTPRKRQAVGENQPICFARTCYDHLAGEIGVKLALAFERNSYLSARGEREYEVTARGEAFFANWRIDISELRGQRRSFARRCLDWTERRDHLAGALGAAVLQRFLSVRWMTQDRDSRVVHLTPRGRQELSPLLD
jgi:DNA-binding transcriptional ArsR family regulator/DNA-binding PadR family transcriptional regulator